MGHRGKNDKIIVLRKGDGNTPTITLHLDPSLPHLPLNDSELARSVRMPRTTLRDKLRKAGIPAPPKGTEWDKVEGLKTKSCGQLARELGVSTTAARKAKNCRGIPHVAHDLHKNIPWDNLANSNLLGGMPDTKLARLLNCTHSTVYRARVSRGIPAFKKTLKVGSRAWIKEAQKR